MIAPTPYTRKAVQLIRDGATAFDLGWAESTFDNVCRTHGIARLKVEAPPASSPDVHQCRGISFNWKSGEVIRAGIAVALPVAQNATFRVLYDRFAAANDEFICASAISDLMPIACTPRNVVFTMARMNDRLAPLQVWIEGKLGSNGGYRLRVDA